MMLLPKRRPAWHKPKDDCCAGGEPKMKAMTGADLIRWIQDNHAEQLQVLVEHRDEGGSYRSAEHLGEQQEPVLCTYGDEMFGMIRRYEFKVDEPTAIML